MTAPEAPDGGPSVAPEPSDGVGGEPTSTSDEVPTSWLAAVTDPHDPTSVHVGRRPARLRVVEAEELTPAMPTWDFAGMEAAATPQEALARALAHSEVLDVSVRPDRFLTPSSSTYTIGSCFAINVRRVLRERGFDVHPRTSEIEVDPATQHIGRDRPLNHYDTFTIRQEIERALDPDAWSLDAVPSTGGRQVQWAPEGGSFVQDPARMWVFGADVDALADLSARITEASRVALEVADVIIISLGLIETWVDDETGRHVWSAGVRGTSLDPERFRFHLSTYEENLDNVRWICDALAAHRPGARIVLTVSPVGLGRTFTGRDVVVANTYSKSVLRAVAGAVEAERSDVTYWPSYEIATRANLFGGDLRHITDTGVEFIVNRFVAAHTTTSG